MKRLEPHPYCLIFPAMDRGGLAELTDDIREYGQRVPIVLYEGKILDGRSRYEAVIRSGRKPHFRPFEGTKDEALQYAVSLNLHRRHLTPSQKAAVAFRVKHGLIENGVPKETAERLSRELSGASERSADSFERIAAKNPKVAAKIANGQTTIHAVEMDQRRLTPLDHLWYAVTFCDNAAHRVTQASESCKLPGDVRKLINELESKTSALKARIDDLRTLEQKGRPSNGDGSETKWADF